MAEAEEIVSEDSRSPTTRNNEKSLLDDYDKLVNSSLFSDFQITVNDNGKSKDIYCHKSILWQRWAYFRLIYGNEYTENAENKLNIIDFSYDVMVEVMRFVYTAKVRRLETFNKELLKAADKVLFHLQSFKIKIGIISTSVYLNYSFVFLYI